MIFVLFLAEYFISNFKTSFFDGNLSATFAPPSTTGSAYVCVALRLKENSTSYSLFGSGLLLLGKGIAKELLDPEKFKMVFIEPGGGIAWPNGYDFCPNFLKELAGEESRVN